MWHMSHVQGHIHGRGPKLRLLWPSPQHSSEFSINIQAKLHESWLHEVSSLWISIMFYLYPHDK